MRTFAFLAIAAFTFAGCLHIDVHKTEEISSVSTDESKSEYNDQRSDD